MSNVVEELGVVEAGEGEHLVVFVHGVLDRGRSFARVVEHLAGECRTLWYDRRGYGSSLDAATTPPVVDDHVADLLAILDGRRVVLVGHSFGGVTVLSTALQHPELVAAAVIYETGMAWVPGWDDTHLSELLWGEEPEEAGMRMLFRDRIATMSDEALARLRREARAFVAEERSVRTGQPPFDVGQLTVPLIYGRSDGYRFPVVARHLAAVVPDVSLVVLPGAGHNAHRTQPAAFADLVRGALARA